MQLRVEKTNTIHGVVSPPSSKSQSVRALLVATLASGKSVIHNVLEADDTEAAKNVAQALGAKLVVVKASDAQAGTTIEVESTGLPIVEKTNSLFTANSGITTRFVLPLLGYRKNTNEPITLDCGVQMRARPLRPLIGALNEMGMQVVSEENSGTCPLVVTGKLLGGTIAIDGTTSQYLSALLLSLPLAPNDSVVTVENLNERSYAALTLEWLKEQNIQYTHEQTGIKDIYTITGRQTYKPFTKHIAGDWSSASYLIAVGVLLPGEVKVEGLDFKDPQGDKRLVEILKAMGADIERQENSLIIHGGKPLKGMVIDCNDIPDMVPTLAVIATYASGITELTNVPQARLKETDRLKSMYEGLKKMGADISEKPDGLVIKNSSLHGAEVHGYDDHRTVMSFALAGLLAEGETIIDTAEAISKTFPLYVDMMRSLGAHMTLK